jgi:hypothetical protein
MGGSFLERPNLPNFIVQKYTHIWHQEQNFQYFINYLIYNLLYKLYIYINYDNVLHYCYTIG